MALTRISMMKKAFQTITRVKYPKHTPIVFRTLSNRTPNDPDITDLDIVGTNRSPKKLLTADPFVTEPFSTFNHKPFLEEKMDQTHKKKNNTRKQREPVKWNEAQPRCYGG